MEPTGGERAVSTQFQDLVLTWRPNQYLVLPPGFAGKAKPHRVSPIYDLAPAALIDAVARVALAEPRTQVASRNIGEHRLELVQRSKVFRFPDFVSVQAFPAQGGSALAVYSRAKLGIRDFGVNRGRVERWLAALEAGAAKRA